MSSTNYRSNVGAIRSMQIGRGARIRTFRQLNQRDTAIQAKDTPHVGDTNGEQYTQVPRNRWRCRYRHSAGAHQICTRHECRKVSGWYNTDCVPGVLRVIQALDRLTSFKVRHKKRVWQDRRKADWQEEDAQLKRASNELTKSIQVLKQTM